MRPDYGSAATGFRSYQAATIDRLFEEYRPQAVIHGAATVGGIGAIRDNPGLFFYENAIMGIQMIEACRRYGVEKTVVLGTICSYPKYTPVPFREEALWEGYPKRPTPRTGSPRKPCWCSARLTANSTG